MLRSIRLVGRESCVLRYEGVGYSAHKSKRCLHTSSEKKGYDTDVYVNRVQKAQTICAEKVHKYDPSSFLLARFLPTCLQPTFYAIRSFGIELSKVSLGSASSFSQSARFGDIKLAFWLEQVEKCEQLGTGPGHIKGLNDPTSILLADSILKGINIDIGMLRQMIFTHKHYLHEEKVKGFTDLDSMCSFGEGTYSQMNYLLQSASLTPNLYGYSDFGVGLLEQPNTDNMRNLLSDISAHIGQATAICSFIIGLKYFVMKSGCVTLPIDILVKHAISQEDTIRLLSGKEKSVESIEKLNAAIFDVTTRANDHILAARQKLDQLKAAIKDRVEHLNENDTENKMLIDTYHNLRRGLPDCIYTPFMCAIPTVLYLERLQKYDFNVMSPRLQYREWKLAWRAYQNFRKRTI